MAIPRLTGEDIEEMCRLCGRMWKLTAPGQRHEYLNSNRQFHFVGFRGAVAVLARLRCLSSGIVAGPGAYRVDTVSLCP